MRVVVGSRGSKLALRQTEWVLDELKKVHEDLEFEVKVISTKGDRVQNVSLNEIGGKGVFVKEIEAALLSGEIDLAVHSMKDMPSEVVPGLVFGSAPKREDPRDVLVTRHKVKTLEALPKGSIIGTGSKRRKYQLLQLRPDFKVVDIRGNIDTRIQKMLDEPMDGIVLAAAGLNRLGIEDNEFFNSILLDVENFVPSPTQGILALQVKASNTKLLECFKGIGHKETNVQALVERDFLRALNGSCQVPIGAFCEVRGNRLKLYGLFGNEACTTVIQKSIEGTREDQEYLGKRLAEELLKEVRACQEKSI